MDRHLARSRRLVGSLVVVTILALAIGSTPAAARAVVAAAGAGLATFSVSPGLRAEQLIVVGPGAQAGLDGAVESGPTSATAIAVARPEQPKPAPPRAAAAPPAYSGANHVWSAALGLNRSVAAFPCSRSRPPDMAIYRWGCAGHNNVYLFAHAGGPFGRLHDLYVRGDLRRGLTVTYADANRTVHRYRVAWWKVVLPTNGDFAYAAQSRPSMTLQTCVGANDRYRLVVRLYQAD